jgi:hypothetical protein
VPWLTPVILATEEAEIGGSQFKASPDKCSGDPISKNTYHKKRAGEDAQGEGPEFKPQN